MRHILAAFFFALCLAAPVGCFAASGDPIDLRPIAQALLTDRCPPGELAAIVKLPNTCFVPYEQLPESVATTYVTPAMEWLRLRLPAAVGDGTPRVVRMSWTIDRGQLEVVGPDGTISGESTFGNEIPVEQRSLPMYDDRVALPPHVRPGEWLVIRLNSQRTQFPTLELWTPAGLSAKDAADRHDYTTPLVFVNGILVAMAIFNVLLFMLLRHRSYLLYSLAMLAMVLYQLIQSGVAWTLLWPGLSVRDDIPAYLVWITYLGLITAFAREFLSLPRVAPRMDKVLIAAFCLALGSAIVYVGFPGLIVVLHLWGKLDPLVTMIVIGTLIYAGCAAWQKGELSARYYVVGFSGAAATLVFADAVNYGVITGPVNPDLWGEVGVAWEAIFLAFALAERIRAAEREAARLSEFAYLDQLTGIANRRAFDEAIDREWRRGTRTPQPLSLLIFDIDYFKQFNDRYGHQQGDEALRLVAAEIARAARRPGDFAARYGGEEFALVLAETARGGAIATAETIRRAVRELAIPHGDGILTVSVGTATLAPDDIDGTARLILLADGALYEAKASGRDRTIAAAADEA